MNKKKENLDSLTLEQKIEMVEQICVVHPQFQEIIDKIDYCRKHAKRSQEAIGMLVTGESGNGKTTIQNYYFRKKSFKTSGLNSFVPILHVRIPVPATVGGMTTCLLTALKDPFPSAGSIVVRTFRIYHLVNKCRVEVVLFDEFQHFSDRESFKLNRTVSDWTKNFMGETKKPVILFGTPKSVDILDGNENEQLKRRFPFRIALESFGWQTDEKQDSFRKFLQKVEDLLPLPEPSNLSDPDVAYRIYYASSGRIHNVMRLIRAAAIMALEREFRKVHLALLSESFMEHLSANDPDLDNPFID